MLVELKSLRKHVQTCDFMPVVCTNEGCSKPLNKKDKKHHENEVRSKLLGVIPRPVNAKNFVRNELVHAQ